VRPIHWMGVCVQVNTLRGKGNLTARERRPTYLDGFDD
jgi:hypothetical protein